MILGVVLLSDSFINGKMRKSRDITLILGREDKKRPLDSMWSDFERLFESWLGDIFLKLT